MKITRIETIVVTMPMVIDAGAVPMQGGRPRTAIDMLLVRVDTDAGITGWGEAFGHRIFPATRAAIDTVVAVERIDGHWYLSDFLRNARAAAAAPAAMPSVVPPTETATKQPPSS